jgi:hypothetical protein
VESKLAQAEAEIVKLNSRQAEMENEHVTTMNKMKDAL